MHGEEKILKTSKSNFKERRKENEFLDEIDKRRRRPGYD